MSENLPSTPAPEESQQPQPPPPEVSRREARQDRRAERRARRDRDSWIVGLVLVLIGIVFLLQTLGLFFLINWWALFILIPAIAAFAGAWREYRSAGQMTGGVRGSLFGGLLITLVALILLFNLDWGIFWPILLIIGGLGLLLTGFTR
jgi:cation transport ATPase